MLAAKYFDDLKLTNKDFGAIGGLKNPEVNQLELDFMLTVGFSLHVSKEEFETYAEAIFNTPG